MVKTIISVTEFDKNFYEKVFQHIKNTPKLKAEVKKELRSLNYNENN